MFLLVVLRFRIVLFILVPVVALFLEADASMPRVVTGRDLGMDVLCEGAK